MTTRTAHLEYRTTGAGRARGEVISLAQALEMQKRKAIENGPALRRAAADTGFLGAVSQSAAAKNAALANSLGPVGAGMSYVARTAPAAAAGLFAYTARAERASLLTRALNTSILAGAGTMAAASVASVAYFDNVVRGADAYAAMTARINIFTEGAFAQAQAQREIYDTARDARSGVEGLVTLYTRLTPAVRDAGRAQADALRITELVAKSNLIGGGGVREAEAGTIQFAQAIGSGVMRGDEFRSLMEAQPMLMRYIARNLQIGDQDGVAFSQLRALAEEGELTADRILTALLAAEAQIEADFANAPRTAAQGWQVLSDQITRTIGQISQSTGLQRGIVDWLSDMADGIDQFRMNALMNPDALQPLEDAQNLIGGFIAGIGDLGEEAVEHLDLIVSAGTALISLKLGEVFAGWFAMGVDGARRMSATLAEFRANAPFAAGAAVDATGAEAARNLRATAMAQEARAVEMRTAAEIKLAQAQIARKAATDASARADQIAMTQGAQSAAAVAARTQATALAATADRLKAQATKEGAAADAAAAAASTRKTLAEAAEARVTAQATAAQIAKNAAMRVGIGLYNMLGGAAGVATLVIGGLTWAIWEAERAYRAKIEAMREDMVISGQLTAINQALAGATWAQVPALIAAAQAHRERAAAAREDAEAQLALLEERRAVSEGFLANPTIAPGGPEASGLGLAMTTLFGGRQERDIRAALAAADRDEVSARNATAVQNLTLGWLDRARRQEENRTGRDTAGREISADRRAENEREIARLADVGTRTLESIERAMTAQEAEIASETDPARRGRLERGLSEQRAIFEAAAQLANPGAEITPPPTATQTGGGGSRGGARDNSAAEAERAAREAEAAAERAARANERWFDMMADMNGRHQGAIRAERLINELRADGADITEDAAAAYVAWAAAQDRARAAAQALQTVQQDVSDAMDRQLALMPSATNARGGVDVRQAAQQIADARIAANREAEERVREQAQRDREANAWTDEQFERELADRLAAIRVAAEIDTMERLRLLRQQAAEEEVRYVEERIAETSDRLESSVNDLFFARSWDDVANIGSKLMNDMMQAMYEELIGNPLRHAIQAGIRQLISDSAKGGSGWQNTFLNVVGSALGLSGGGGSGAGLSKGSYGGTWNKGGGLPGKAGGGLIVGPGTGTSDSILGLINGRPAVRVSDGEYIVKAEATRRHFALLTAINEDRLPAYAAGGPVGGGSPSVRVQAGAPSIQIINNSRAQVTERRETGPDGLTRLYLEDMPDRMVKKAGATGALSRAARMGPQPRSRP